MRDFKFKLVDLTFDMKKLPSVDQEYLRTMVFEAVGERSVKSSGLAFHTMYPDANNFTLFDDQNMMINYMTEFNGDYACTASHLLEGKKFWFAWTHSG